jgi:hypothetical protein
MEITAETIKNLKVQLETHVFTCTRFMDSPDSGFTSNLWLLLEAIEHSDKVQDEGIKLIAKGLLGSVINHQIHKHDMDEMNARLLEHRAKEADNAKATEIERLKAELAL